MKIPEFLLKLVDKIQQLFKWLPNWVSKVMPEIFQATGFIKMLLGKGRDWLNSATADEILELIPGDWDRQLRDRLTVLLDKTIPVLDNTTETAENWGQMLIDFLNSLNKMSPAAQNAQLAKLSSLMLCEHDGGKLAENRYDTLAQLAYSKIEKSDKELAA